MKKIIFVCLLMYVSFVNAQSTIVFSEIYIDQSGQNKSWIELQNISSKIFFFNDLYLSDSLSNNSKWKIQVSTGSDVITFRQKNFQVISVGKISNGSRLKIDNSILNVDTLYLFGREKYSNEIVFFDKIQINKCQPNMSFARIGKSYACTDVMTKSVKNAKMGSGISKSYLNIESSIGVSKGYFNDELVGLDTIDQGVKDSPSRLYFSLGLSKNWYTNSIVSHQIRFGFNNFGMKYSYLQNIETSTGSIVKGLDIKENRTNLYVNYNVMPRVSNDLSLILGFNFTYVLKNNYSYLNYFVFTSNTGEITDVSKKLQENYLTPEEKVNLSPIFGLKFHTKLLDFNALFNYYNPTAPAYVYDVLNPRYICGNVGVGYNFNYSKKKRSNRHIF